MDDQTDQVRKLMATPVPAPREPKDVLPGLEALAAFFRGVPEKLRLFTENEYILKYRSHELENLNERLLLSLNALQRLQDELTKPTQDVIQTFIQKACLERFARATKLVGDYITEPLSVTKYNALEYLTATAWREVPSELKADLRAGHTTPAALAWFKSYKLREKAAKLVGKSHGWGDPVRILAAYFTGLANTVTNLQEQFDLVRIYQRGAVKIFILDPSADPSFDASVRKTIETGLRSVAGAGFKQLLYGKIFYVSRENLEFTPEMQAEAKKLGYDIQRAAGDYDPHADAVRLFVWPHQVVETLVHELGHRYWFQFMSSGQRARYNDLVQTKAKTTEVIDPDEEYPPSETDMSGAEKPVTPVSDYGASNVHEAFAEAFMHYVLRKQMNPDQRDSFRSVLALTTPQKILDRYIQAKT